MNFSIKMGETVFKKRRFRNVEIHWGKMQYVNKLNTFINKLGN